MRPGIDRRAGRRFQRLWPGAGLGALEAAWDYLRGEASAASTQRSSSSLDARLDDLAGDELTFAEWFTRWDSGPRPLIVDRVALNRAGFGPKSVCTPSRASAERRSISLETLEQHGLGLVIFPNALVDHDGDRARRDSTTRTRWARAIAEALLWGADRGDRFQGLPRWRGESSPRLTALGGDEAGERIKLLDGWSTWRFAAPGWPGNDAYLYLIDGRARIVSAWLIAAVLRSAGLSAGGGSLRLVAVLRAHRAHDREPVAQLAASCSICELCRRSLCRRSLDLDRRAEHGNGQASRIAAADRELAGAPGAGAAVATALLGLLLARAASGQPPVQPGRGLADPGSLPVRGPIRSPRGPRRT